MDLANIFGLESLVLFFKECWEFLHFFTYYSELFPETKMKCIRKEIVDN